MNAAVHDASGVDCLGELVPADAKVYQVILTPKGVEPQINVPTAYLTAETLRVFHCTIDTAKSIKPSLFKFMCPQLT